MAINLTYDLVNYTPADASPVEANFNRVEQYVNQELINRDGTVAMTADLHLATDPSTPLAAATKQYVDAILPIGIIMQYGGAVTPPGGRWALCDGTLLATASYPELFAVIAYRYGGSGGSFNLPNLVGRVSVGAGGSGVLGATGGSRDAVVTAHTHPIDHDHPAFSTGTESADHVHNMDHYHNQLIGNTGNVSANHFHYLDQLGTLLRSNSFAPTAHVRINDGTTMPIDTFAASAVTTNYETNDHSHGVNGITNYASQTNAAWLSTGGISVNHTHIADVPALTGTSGAASGAVSATDANMPPYQVLNNLIRVA